MKRLIIIANKAWECHPAMAAMFDAKFAFNKEMLKPSMLISCSFPYSAVPGALCPRAKWTDTAGYYTVELWCLENIMQVYTKPVNPAAPPKTDEQRYYSSSSNKADALSSLFQQLSLTSDDLVVAYGTAGYPSLTSINGSVVVGATNFIYNCFPEDANTQTGTAVYSNYAANVQTLLCPPTIPSGWFDRLSIALTDAVEQPIAKFFRTRWLNTPNNPAAYPSVFYNTDYVALSNINVTDYGRYKYFDEKGLYAAKAQIGSAEIMSVETTHGVIRHCAGINTNFVWVSAITDRAGFFDEEVATRAEAQNFAAAFNGGVFLNFLASSFLAGKL